MADNITVYRGRRAASTRRWLYALLLLLLLGGGWGAHYLVNRQAPTLAVSATTLTVAPPTIYQESPPLAAAPATVYSTTSPAVYQQPDVLAVPPPADYEASPPIVAPPPADYDAPTLLPPPVVTAAVAPPPEELPLAAGSLDNFRFYVNVPRATKQLRICVRDHSCQDGDRVRLSVNGDPIYVGEIFKNPRCATATVHEGENVLDLHAINGSGNKGLCSYLPVNTGQVLISGTDWQSAKWELAPGKSAVSKIHVTLE